MKYRIWAMMSVVALGLATLSAQAVTMDLVTVGDAGNAADTTSYGAVAYQYNIGKYDVTNAQYCEFLTAVATNSDAYGLWNDDMSGSYYGAGGINRSGPINGPFTYTVNPGMGNQPAVFVTWYDAIRFANWLTNGQGSGDTESGAYTITGPDGMSTTAPSASQRAAWAAAGQTHWLLPSENEWYKAAYYKGGGANAGYWRYPTQSNTIPPWKLGTATGPNPGTNSANFRDPGQNGFALTGSTTYDSHFDYLTNVGAYPDSVGPYGTLDQGGDVCQWNETLIAGAYRGFRGGSWNDGYYSLASATRQDYNPWLGSGTIGFRVVRVGGFMPGDANGDGKVDITDLNKVLTNYNKTGLAWDDGDFDASGMVDVADLNKALTNYNKGAAGSAGAKAVPEPSTIALWLAGAVGLLAHAWKRRA